MKNGILQILTVFLLACANAHAISSGELLQQALYAEEIEGDLPAAIADYEKVANDASASEKQVAQALYRQGMCHVRLKQDDKAEAAFSRLVNQYADQTALIEKAQPLLDSIQTFDPATLMPPETLAYLELGSTGKQIETILEMLKGTPLENPLAAISRNNSGGMRSGEEVFLAGLLNPAMQEEFKKIRGMAVGLVDIAAKAPPSIVGVLHLGDSSMLRGLLMTGLSMAGRPGPTVEGMQTYSIQGHVHIACDDKVFLVAISSGSRLQSMIRQYKHLSSDASLASDPSFRKIDKAARQQNLATLWMNTDDLYTRIAQQMPQDRPTEFQIAAGVVNITTIDDLVLTASLAADVIGLDGRIHFKEGMQNLIYEMIKTPAIVSKGLDGVPADAFGLLSFDLEAAGSMQAAQLRMLAMNSLGVDLPASLLDSVNQISLFALPSTNGLDHGVPLRPGLVIACTDTAPVMQFFDGLKAEIGGKGSTLLLEAADGVVVAADTPEVIEAAKNALAGKSSVNQGGWLHAAVGQNVGPTFISNKLLLANVGGYLHGARDGQLQETAAPLSEEQQARRKELYKQMLDGLEELSKALESTTLAVHTEEAANELVLKARLSVIPPLSKVVGPIMQIQDAGGEMNSIVFQAASEDEMLRRRQERAATICPAEVAPVIDGEGDAAWTQARNYKLENSRYNYLNPTNQTHAVYGMLWDATNLYVGVQVVDNTPNCSPEREWQDNDSVVLYIDATDSKSRQFGPTDYAFVFQRGGADMQPTMDEIKHHTEGITWAVGKLTEAGYLVEVAIPWKTLGVDPAVASKIGVDVQVNDNQFGEKRNGKMWWLADQDAESASPAMFGRAELAGLVGYWPCDEMEGAMVGDESGRGHDGSFQGNAQWAQGRVGGALDLNGRSSYVLIPDESAFDLTGELTIACWVNIRSVTADWMPFVTKGNTSWRLSTGPDREASYHLGLDNQPSGARATTPWPGVLGEWHHVTATYGSNTMQIYVDGNLWATELCTGGITPNNSPVMIGANAEAMDRWFDGLIDEVRVYNRALSADEIKMLVSAGQNPVGQPVNKKQVQHGESAPLDKMIDLTPFSQSRFKASEKYAGMTDQPVFDGLPFDLACSLELYGTQNATRGNELPRKITDIPVGITFDELHLLHSAAWEEVQDCPVAIIRLHYEGGGSHDFQIKYRVHLSDWNRLPSEAAEVLTDPDSKIVWRGEGAYGGTGRLFKTMLRNPHPDRIVQSMDVFSTGTRVSYQLLAATVAKSDPQRDITPGLPLNQPAFHFDGTLKVIALDARTGKPIPGADVFWQGRIAYQNIVAPPQLTGTNGETVIKYPVAGTEQFSIQVTKAGYRTTYLHWNRNNTNGEMTFLLEPLSVLSF